MTVSSKRNNKPYKLTATAKDLFWKFGISRVTVEEICREAGVSRMTFYKYFRDKNDIAKKIIEAVLNASMEKYDSIMKGKIKFDEKVRRLIRLKIEGTNDISKEFLKDFYNHDNSDLYIFFSKKIKESLDRLQSDFKTASKKGEIRQKIKPEFIMYILNRMMEMSNDQELLKIYDSPQEMIMEMTNIFFYGIFPTQKRK